MRALIPFIPRTRSSTLAQLCAGAGLEVLGDFTPKDRNPLGDGEGPYSQSGADFSVVLGENQVMKVLLSSFLALPIPADIRVLFPLRDPASVSVSQERWGIWNPTDFLRRMNYWRLSAQFALWMDRAPNPVLVVDTDALIQDPASGCDRISAFLGVTVSPNTVIPQMTGRESADESDSATAIYMELLSRCV